MLFENGINSAKLFETDQVKSFLRHHRWIMPTGSLYLAGCFRMVLQALGRASKSYAKHPAFSFLGSVFGGGEKTFLKKGFLS
ncbi:MAG: hypothetical protein IJZ19_03860, partial [Lentisphaeria bacterium]|nr:hypothetical protein [Lentisphaeria bacterium]